jgi:glycosyltransferase involved in cell wall biosynthesis
MTRSALVFNRSDKHSAFGEVDSSYIESLERGLLEASDRVAYVSHTLLEEDRATVGDRAAFLDHGVDLRHFRRRAVEEIPADLLAIPSPRIGFFGGIDDYVVDLDLLAKTARAFPDASLVLIGDATCPLDDLESLPNVHLMGARPYATIPAYGSGFDIALMPWLDNDWIKACNPIKAKEYLALGLAVVTTWYPEVQRYQHLMSTCRSHDGFIEAIRRLLAGDVRSSPTACREAVLRDSWDNRTAELRQLAEGVR